MISNIWQHPKTSIAGALLCAVTVASVLSQQGITLGRAGTGSVVTLIAAIGTALLGLLSRDPGAAPSGTGTKLGALALCLLFVPLSFTAGCTASQVDQVVQKIGAYLPTAVAILQDALAIYTAVGTQPGEAASPAQSALAKVQSDLQAIQKPLSDYLAASSKATKATAWTNIQALVDTAAADTDVLLQVASVKNAQSQQAGVVVVASLDAAVHVLDGYLATAQTPAQVQARMARRTLKLRTVSQSWSDSDRQQVAQAFGAPFGVVLRAAEGGGF